MRYRFFVGSGFVLGFMAAAWAGRDRYEIAMRRMRGAKDHPSVHATAGVLHAHAAGAVDSAKRAVIGTSGGGRARSASDRTMAPPWSINGDRPDPGGASR